MNISRFKALGEGLLVPVAVVLLWQIACSAGWVNPMVLPSPAAVAARWWSYLAPLEPFDPATESKIAWIFSGELIHDSLASLSRVVMGFVVGAGLALPLGLFMGTSDSVYRYVNPLMQVLRPIPPIAFVSIVILWFGLSEGGKVFLIVWGVFFTVWLSTHLGVQKVDQGLVRAAQMLGTPRRRLVGEVVLLSALPFIVVGLRTAVGISFYTLVAAELAGAFAGIFYRIQLAQQNMQTGLVFAGLAALGLISFIADRCFAMLAQRLVWWR